MISQDHFFPFSRDFFLKEHVTVNGVHMITLHHTLFFQKQKTGKKANGKLSNMHNINLLISVFMRGFFVCFFSNVSSGAT